jgi:hypothetical protein
MKIASAASMSASLVASGSRCCLGAISFPYLTAFNRRQQLTGRPVNNVALLFRAVKDLFHIGCQLGIGGFHQKLAVFKNDGRNDAFALVGVYDKLFSFGIFFDIDPGIRDLMFTQKLFAASAVRAPVGAVNTYF